MERRATTPLVVGALVISMLGFAASAQDRRVVTQPVTPAPPYCQVLHAKLPKLSPTAFVPPRAFDDSIENSPPDTARINLARRAIRNSDAFDPNGADWTITQSYISVDDDDVAIKGGTVLASGAPSAQFMTIAHNHFYSGAARCCSRRTTRPTPSAVSSPTTAMFAFTTCTT